MNSSKIHSVDRVRLQEVKIRLVKVLLVSKGLANSLGTNKVDRVDLATFSKNLKRCLVVMANSGDSRFKPRVKI
jgi:hypothetical protein